MGGFVCFSFLFVFSPFGHRCPTCCAIFAFLDAQNCCAIFTFLEFPFLNNNSNNKLYNNNNNNNNDNNNNLTVIKLLLVLVLKQYICSFVVIVLLVWFGLGFGLVGWLVVIFVAFF